MSKPSPCDKEHPKETNVSQSAPALTHSSSTLLKQQSCEYSAEDIEVIPHACYNECLLLLFVQYPIADLLKET